MKSVLLAGVSTSARVFRSPTGMVTSQRGSTHRAEVITASQGNCRANAAMTARVTFTENRSPHRPLSLDTIRPPALRHNVRGIRVVRHSHRTHLDHRLFQL